MAVLTTPPGAAHPERFPVLFTERERRQWPLCPRDVPWAMLAPHDRRAQKNHGGQTLHRLAERGGLDPIELVCVLDDREYPQDTVRADIPKAKQWAVNEVIKRVAAWEGNAAPVVTLRAGWVWECLSCSLLNPAKPLADGSPPPRTQCQFCKTIHTAEVPAPPVDQPEDDPAAHAAGDPSHAANPAAG